MYSAMKEQFFFIASPLYRVKVIFAIGSKSILEGITCIAASFNVLLLKFL